MLHYITVRGAMRWHIKLHYSGLIKWPLHYITLHDTTRSPVWAITLHHCGLIHWPLHCITLHYWQHSLGYYCQNWFETRHVCMVARGILGGRRRCISLFFFYFPFSLIYFYSFSYICSFSSSFFTHMHGCPWNIRWPLQMQPFFLLFFYHFLYFLQIRLFKSV